MPRSLIRDVDKEQDCIIRGSIKKFTGNPTNDGAGFGHKNRNERKHFVCKNTKPEQVQYQRIEEGI